MHCSHQTNQALSICFGISYHCLKKEHKLHNIKICTLFFRDKMFFKIVFFFCFRFFFHESFTFPFLFYLFLTFCPFRKAIRATVILMPLLGLTNLIMLFNPNDGGSYASVYQVTNVVLHSNQVSVKV